MTRGRTQRALARVRALFRADRLDADLQEDLATHFELLAEEYIRKGMSPVEARRVARLRFGSMPAAEELHRDVRSFRWMETARSEFRWARRAVRARGWQAVMVVLLLAIAIAANTIVFSAADAFVFRRAPYLQSDRLVLLEYRNSFGIGSSFSGPAILEWRRQQDVLSAVHAHSVAAPLYLTIGDITESVRAAVVTPGLLEMLGGAPLWGRPLMESDGEKGALRVAVIGEDLARRVFGGGEAAVGRQVSAEGGPITVVGVMHSSFRFPAARERIWLPLGLEGQSKNVGYSTLARLTPGMTLEEAAARLAQRAEPIDRATGSFFKRYPLTVRRLGDAGANDRYSGIFGMLAAAALCLLLIACANVASLELALALRRARAMGVRAALGAGRGTLVRTQLMESAILCGISVAGAVVLTWWGMDALTKTLPPSMAQELSNAIDWDARAMLFTVAIVGVAWLLTSAPAAWRASRTQLVDVLTDEARSGAVSRPTRFLRHVLVTGQVAATVLLLTVALLYARTYSARINLDKGFDADSVATISVLPAYDAPLKGQALADMIEAKLASHPAIRSVALATNVYPVTGGWIGGNLTINGGEPLGEVTAHGHGVTSGYFTTMGITLIEGSFFEAKAPTSKVVLDERFAKRFWPDGNAVGSRFRVGGAGYARVSEWEVVGVARHVRPDRLTTESGLDLFVFYYPMVPPRSSVSAVVKLDDEESLPAIANAVRAGTGRSVVRAEMMDDLYARLEGDRKVAAAMTTGMGALALAVATLGIYAVMAFIVSGRRREIGLRLALGATTADVRRGVILHSMTFVVAGSALGLIAAFAGSRWIESQLYGVSATDPLTYAAVTAAVFLMAAIATWFPARQAARVDPAVTLRSQ